MVQQRSSLLAKFWGNSSVAEHRSPKPDTRVRFLLPLLKGAGRPFNLKQMQITLSRYAGFCDGVERAYEIAKEAANNPQIKKPIYVLGSLVHNQDVVDRIEKMGIRKIHVDGKIFKLLNSKIKEIGTLIITAHGMGPRIYEFVRKKKINLIDTTCPRVIKVQKLAKLFLDKSRQIVIVGEKDHKEVKGIYEWTNKTAVFVENEDDLKRIELNRRKKIAVISQTTQNQEFVKKAEEFIKNKYPQVEVIDTLCLTTHHRQDEVWELAKNQDAVIVIGSTQSANSTRLWEIAKKINPKSYFVERAKQIKKTWLKDCKKVGVTAGASTPDWVINEVMAILKKI